MSIEKLQQLGFSLNEARIYEALLNVKEATVSEISLETKVHRRNVYDTLKRLIDKGLVFPIVSEGERLYSPVDPDKLTELIKTKEVILESILPELKKRYQQREINQEAYIYRGLEGMKNYIRDILRVGKDLYCIGAKLGWFDPRLEIFTEEVLKEVKRKKIKFYILYDAEIKGKDPDKIKLLGPYYKFLPKGYSTNSSVTVFGDYVVIFAGITLKKIEDNVTIFVLKDKNLAESYRTWFNFLYDKCQKSHKEKELD